MSEENNILNELREMGSPLADMPRRMPYAVPDNYFEGAEERILAVAGGLPGVKAELPYGVPQGYFEVLPEKMLAASKQADKGTRTVTFVPRMQWATAAVLVLMISLGGYITFRGQVMSEPEHLLSSVPASEIRAYVENRYEITEMHGSADSKLSGLQLNKREIESYLNDNGWE